MTALELIAAERERQVEKGYTAHHDDLHDQGALAAAASCYAYLASLRAAGVRWPAPAPAVWPWSILDWRPSGDRLTDLVKAGALIVAEIERLQRLRQNQA